MIRLLEIVATLKRAGAERVAVTLATRLDRSSFDTSVVSLYAPFEGGFEPVLEQHSVPVTHLGKRRGFDPRLYPRLAAAIRRLRPDVIHTHSYILRYVLAAARLSSRAAIVHTVHNLARREVEPLGRAIHRLAFRLGVVPVAISDEIARSFRNCYGLPPAAVIPNGVDLSAPPAGREAWRAANGFAAGDLLIASVARLEEQKNPLLLIEAFARAAPAHPRARLLLAGQGSLEPQAREKAAAAGVAPRVHFLGVRQDVPGLLAASDLCALASSWEGSPVALMEALAAGLPAVATAVGGVPELVADGETGLLVPPGDSRRFAAALSRLLSDPSLRAAMGRAAARSAGRFDARNMIDGYAALFRKVAAG